MRGPALLAFVLVTAVQVHATAGGLATFTCFDGQVGTVSISEGGVSPFLSTMCDVGAEADGVCLFSFCQHLGCSTVCRCPRPRRVRVGHVKWYRRTGRVLVCEPPQPCKTDADCIQPVDAQCARNRCVGTVEPGIFGKCQRDPACP